MPKKKQDPEVETTTPEEAPAEGEFSHDEIAGKSFEEIAIESPAEEPTPEPEPETPQEPEPEPVEASKVEIDVEAERAKAAAEAKAEALKEVADKLANALNPKQEEGAPVDEELVSPWVKEKRNPRDYDEIADWAAEKNRILTERNARAEAERTRAEQEAAEKQAEEARKTANSYIDSQIDELIAAGKLPKITSKEAAANPEEETDPGRRARRRLFETWAKVNMERQVKGLPPVTSPKEIYYEHYSAEEVPGADAPISGAGAPTSDDGGDFSYAEIHGTPFERIR